MHYTVQVVWQTLLSCHEAPLGESKSHFWLYIVQVYPNILISVRPRVGVLETQAVQELVSDSSITEIACALKRTIR